MSFSLRRTLAFSIDFVCAAFPLIIVSPVAVIFWGSGSEGHLAALTILNVNAFLSLILYYLGRTIQLLRGAQTPGQQLMRLHFRKDEEKLSWDLIFLRGFLSIVFVVGLLLLKLYPLLLLNFAWILVDSQGRSLIDALLKIRVVEDGRSLQPAILTTQEETSLAD